MQVCVNVLSFILRATRSAAGPFWLLEVAIWGAWCVHVDILGDHFVTSGASRGAILVPQDHLTRPCEQQDGLEIVVYGILFDLG